MNPREHGNSRQVRELQARHRQWQRMALTVCLLAVLIGVLAWFAAARAAEPSTEAAGATGNGESPGGAAPHDESLTDLRRAKPIAGDAAKGQARAAAICVGCHGPAGVSLIPGFPHLAGQDIDYLYQEMLAYRRGLHPESPMTAVMATVQPAEIADLAAYYASLAPAPPIAIADQAVFDAGARLFREGDIARGIPPCQGCHGADGGGLATTTGSARLRERRAALAYPHLRHQPAAYIETRLKAYRDGKHHDSSTDRVMTTVASRLDDAEIASLAAWIAAAPAP